MTQPARILIVEDERDLAEGILENFESEGYDADIARDGNSGIECALTGGYDLILLDIMLPGRDGYAVCRRIRQAGNQVPVLFLTAKGEAEDRIRGLEEGGDDYLVKPFQLRELLLRVAAILRRSRWYAEAIDDGVVRFAGHEIDLTSYQARLADGSEYALTHKEAQILKLLSERDGQVVTRDEILDTVWGHGAFPTARTIDNFILRLRRRFEPDPTNPSHFHTVHGAGYRFSRDAAGG